MIESNTASSTQLRSPISEIHTALTRGITAAALSAAFLIQPLGAHAQAAPPAPDATAPAAQTAAPDAAGQAAAPKPDISLTNQKPSKTRKQKDDKVVASKDTKQEDKKTKKDYALQGTDTKLPDKALYDKAEEAVKKGRFDVARMRDDRLSQLGAVEHCQVRAFAGWRRQVRGVSEQRHPGRAVPSVAGRKRVQ